MTMHANKATVCAWIKAWNETDLAAIDDLFTNDYAVNGALVSPDRVKQAVVGLHSAFHDAVLMVEDMVAEEDRVAVRWSLRGFHRGTFMNVPATGKEVNLSGINIYYLADGRIKENHEAVDVHGLLQQLAGAKP